MSKRIIRSYYDKEREDAAWIIGKYLEHTSNNKVIKDTIQSVHDLIHEPQRVVKIGKYLTRKTKDEWIMRLQQENVSGLEGFTEMLAICMLYHNGYLIHDARHYTYTLGNRFLRLAPYQGTIDPSVQVKYGRLILRRYGQLLEHLRQSLVNLRKKRKEFYANQKEPLITQGE